MSPLHGRDRPARVGHASLRQVTHPDGTPGWAVFWSVRVPHGWLPPAHRMESVGVDVGLRNVVTAVNGDQHWLVPGPALPDADLTGVSAVTAAQVRRTLFARQSDEVDAILRAVLTHRLIGIEATNWRGLAEASPERVRQMMVTGAASFRTWVEALAPVTGSRVIAVPAKNSSHACGHCGQPGSVNDTRFTCSACSYTEDADLNAARGFARRARELAAS